MPLIGIVARKKDIKDIKRKLGENYELSELNSESIKNLKNIKFDEIIYNKDINLTEEEYKFMREIINKTKYILINSDEKIKIPMLGKTESLNASVATGIVLYEYVRQKLT